MTAGCRTLLVVDDNVCVREAVAETLASEGYEVLLARDGAEALKSVDRLRLCAVVTDFNMPHMNGDELVARLRQRLPCRPADIGKYDQGELKAFRAADLRALLRGA